MAAVPEALQEMTGCGDRVPFRYEVAALLVLSLSSCGTTRFVATTADSSTIRTTSPTAGPDHSVLAAVDTEFETAEGWSYRIVVTFTGEDRGASVGGCLDAAQAGQTNLLFRVEVENLVTDRPAPIPQIVFASNLGEGGEPLPTTNPFDDAILGLTLGTTEVAPLAPGGSCPLAAGLSAEMGTIGAGGASEHILTVGPVRLYSDPKVVLGIRLFRGDGSWVELVFTPKPGSGTVTKS